jgi:hypothetical protein
MTLGASNVLTPDPETLVAIVMAMLVKVLASANTFHGGTARH